MQDKSRGFTLAELLIVVAIIAVLVAISIPVFNKKLEKSRETVDIANVRSAYSEVMAAVITEDAVNTVKVVKLKQKADYWQSVDPVTVAGITHYNNEGDTANWKGHPVANGECEVSYNPESGILLDWTGGAGGGGTGDTGGYSFDINCNLHKALTDSGLLTNTLKNNINFEIDSRCTRSVMLDSIREELKKDTGNLMNYGTWAYLGSAKKESDRYLFWTSVNTNEVGARQKIPVIISTGDGKFYISETTTATRTNAGGNYVAISGHIETNQYKNYLSGDKQYADLKTAYDAYAELVTKGEYQKYSTTLPKK